EEAEEEQDEVVRTKTIHLDPMNIDEAITRMEAIGHDFFLYLDVDDDEIAVVYKRDDGGYGVIQADNRLK
ncbi:MAG: sigma 54 modulation/S30EA ribosomal C-terminal domain-containing protein, partial [Bacilli bacterium]|nr:sigma 54 modulation/S30EA ribosomal C-terminal domain-containing protein [Bacilli bacterium]